MYTRTIDNPPKKILVKGLPVFGTFLAPPNKLDIKNLKKPFSIMPLPRFITNSRIRGSIEFFFNTDTHAGTIDIVHLGFVCFAETNFWEKSNGKKFSYRSLIPWRKIVPHHLDQGICFSFRNKRYFRMSWDHIEQSFSFVFNYEGDSVRPNAVGAFKSDNNKTWAMLTSVIPFPLKNRCSAVHVSSMPIAGSLSTDATKKNTPSSDFIGQGLFSMRWAFYSLRTKKSIITGFGEWNNKKISFRIVLGSSEPVDKNAYNENVLFVDEEATPLPPVVITRPQGIMGVWVIQDTESMIDVSFKAFADTKRTLSILLLRTEYHTMYGQCEGNLLTKNGEEIPLKHFTVIVKKHSLRL
ncbi:MAG TPA: DUF2804 family protein [Treponemataceae bacterium]|nr:DUF2804 family protein [Treponemataceae bacterium]